MLKLAPWLLEQAVKFGSKVNPSDVLTQSTMDDIAHLFSSIFK